MKRVSMLALLVVVPVLAAEPPATIHFERDVVYGEAGGEQLKLNIAWPKDPPPAGGRPCIVVIHGGAWRAGDRNGHNNLTWSFAEKGYVSATIGYRFVPRHVFPAQVQDVKCAVRFLRKNAEKYGIDKARFGATGFSAGGHLSMMLGTMDQADGLDDSGGSEGESSKVQAVVSYFGPTDMTQVYPPASEKLITDFVGGPRQQKAEALKRVSPVTYVNAGDAPMLLLQGTKDPLVDHSQAIIMVEAMTKAGVPGRVELLIGAGHGWGGAEMRRTSDATLAWFDQYLKKPAGK